uniref:Uncharacterized protein n=1 Tax=Chenopodium quinoa TaxID=63459 RepID=A0A803LDW6_CHEQI
MAAKPSKDRDFLKHLEAYLAKRDGVDKLLKISRYASKFIISSSLLPHAHPVTRRLKSFESSVGLSRKAFRLGKFIQDVNALRSAAREKNQSRQLLLLSLLAYGGEGIYYFVEQIVWLSKSGLIDARHARELQKVSAWAEFVGYIGSITLKVGDLKELDEKLKCLNSSVEIADSLQSSGFPGCSKSSTTVSELDKSLCSLTESWSFWFNQASIQLRQFHVDE